MNSTRRVLVTIGWQAHLAPLVTCVLVYSCGTVEAQTERVRSSHFDDVGFAISFSPDGRTVAVARGSRDGTDQFAGVELWNAQTGELLHTIRGFDGPVWSISFSPDSKLFVTGSTEYSSRQIQQKGPAERFVELKWWDTDSGDLKRKITIPGEWRVSLAATYSPDGRTLATVECYRDPLRRRNLAVASIFEPFPRPSIASGLVIKLVEEQTGLVRRKLEGGFKDVPPGRIHSAVFSQAGQLVSAWVSDKLVTWKTDTGEKVYTVKGFKGRLSALAVSPDGRSLAAGVSLNSGRDAKPNRSSEIRLYEVTTGNLSRTIPVQTNLISSLVYAGNGEQVLVGGLRQLANRSSAVMELVNLQTGSVGAFQGQPEETISSLALSPDGSKLALPLSVFSVGVWSTRTWKLELTLNATEGGNVSRRSYSRFVLTVKRIAAVAFSEGGKKLWAEVEGTGIKQWDTRTGELKKQQTGNEASILAFSSDGQHLAEVDEGRKLHVFDLTGETIRETTALPDVPASALAFSNEGTLAIAEDTQLTIRNLVNGKTDSWNTGEVVNGVTISSDGRTLASVDHDGTIHLWDLPGGRSKGQLVTGSDVTIMRFDPSGELLASGREDGTVNVWDVRSGRLRLKLKKHEQAVNALAFAPNGELVASGGDDRMVIIWNLASGKAKRSLRGHDLTVTSLAFSPDGTLIASGSGNVSVVLWQVDTGKIERVLR